MMSNYSILKSLLTNELTVKRSGFWRPVYELMDGQYSYGMLRYEGAWRPKAIIETADSNWVLSRKGARAAEIKSIEGESMAETKQSFWGSEVTFSANDGFTARLVKPSIWKGTMFWEAADGTELVNMKPRLFNMPVISINVQMKQNRWLLLLAFLALEIHLKRQKQAAAAT